jgi:transaldolase
MKLFAAGAGLADLEPCLRLGLCTGVVLDRRAERDVVPALGRLVDGPIFVPVSPDAGDAAALEAAAREAGALGGAVVARVAFGEVGLAAIRACARSGVPTNAVGCTTPVEALAAARAGARWISPSWELPTESAARVALYEPLRKIVAALQAYGHKAEVLVGPAPDRSILVDVMFAGVHAASSRPAALHEIARRRAQGLEAAGSGS